jgi:hypothetical protein
LSKEVRTLPRYDNIHGEGCSEYSAACGPFVGQWSARGEGLTINADGSAWENQSGSVQFTPGSAQGPHTSLTFPFSNVVNGIYANPRSEIRQ